MEEERVVNKEEILIKWVKQPPAAPLVQYLRDAEKISAWRFTGNKKNVLDIASESSVTLGIKAEHITRVDASPEASTMAKKILQSVVNKFVVVTPSNPLLPFSADRFDAAVSIGPYDWLFLDIKKLTDEVYRVVMPGGIYVVSVPTTKSPYCTPKSKRMFKYYTVEELVRLINNSGWFLTDYVLIYQPPSLLYRLPILLQKILTKFCWLMTKYYTYMRLWNKASYIVVLLDKESKIINYKNYLKQALATVFRSSDDNGFWDTKENKIIRALHYRITEKGEIEWYPDDSIKWRYAPFALMGIMQWRISSVSTDRYDSQLKLELNYFMEKLKDKRILSIMPSYGIGPLILSFSLAYKVFQNEKYKEIAWSLYKYSIKRFSFNNSEDCLCLYGWCFLYEIEKNSNLLSNINKYLENIVRRQNRKGIFIFNNSTTRRHQNQMYTLWGIGKAIEVTERREFLVNMERTIGYTIKRRMLNNGAFIWEDVSVLKKLIHRLKNMRHRSKNLVPYWTLLFECHQTFFVNAVFQYYKAGGSKNYDPEIRQAMDWIYGQNALKKDLVAISGIGVPMRMMNFKGRMDIEGQMFKGAYEVGSYIMALTNLIGKDKSARSV